ncbi:methyltransferase domain-containing protein [Hydrogenophaga soli]
MQGHAQPHVYQRSVSSIERSSLSVLAHHIVPDSVVLDLGCGTGALGHWCSQNAPVVFDGVTHNATEAALARPSYRRVEVGDLEVMNLAATFSEAAYDAIVCADVLEHLRAPQLLLAQCRSLLNAGGKLLISIPNAGYCGLLAELMQGQFQYRDEGLLDRTHLRFFTRHSVIDFLSDHGWRITHMEAIERPLTESEFKIPFDHTPPAVTRHLLGMPDAVSYQFVIACEPATTAPHADNAQYRASTGTAHIPFNAELYLSDTPEFSEQYKLRATGTIGLQRQTLRFEWDRGWPITVQHIRLDPADRPGFLHLFAARLLTDTATPVWEWTAGTPSPEALDLGHVPHHQILWTLPGVATPTPLLLLLDEDPWFVIPIPAEISATTFRQKGAFEIDVGWPMSADHLAAAQTVLALRQQLSEALHQSAASHETQQQQVEQLQKAVHQAANVEHVQKLQLQQLQETLKAITQDRERLKQDHLRLQVQQTETRQQFNELANHLRWIENSTVFRATRPLVHLKMSLQRLMEAPAAPAQSAQATPIQPPQGLVDVIVPVYKGLEDTRRCILSTLASPCKTPFRLIVINDASPEPEVSEWLRDIAATDNRITLLENPHNLGFVETVNRGMTQSAEHDVVLLNSDTEVANDWLDRLRRCAHGDRRIGTVTPFSNNATICSYPRFCTANALVNDQTTASLDALCADTLPGQAVDVPTGVGFCMYIRRDCLTDVGLFDVQNFGKGYGEENDFCRRAAARGWRNMHALDTFVLHAGGVSFGDSKSARELAAMETLRRLYPDYETEVMRYIQLNPAQPHRHLLDLARLKTSPRPKVLAICHNRGGGTLRHVRELAGTLQQDAHFLLLLPTPGRKVSLQFADATEGLHLEFSLESEWEDLVDLLQTLDIVLVHVHHLLGHDPLIQTLPQRLGVPCDFTVHDHYSRCPQISLTDHTQQYCGEQGREQCNRCLKHSPAPGNVTIDTWRDHQQAFLRNCRHILAPSLDTAQRMRAWLPHSDIRIAPHTDLKDISALPQPTAQPLSASQPLRVVVIGALSIIKGADLLDQVAQLAAKSQAPIDFHLVGYAYRNLKTRPGSHLTVHGEYQDRDLPALLNWLQPHVVWFPAVWPETYSYTLSACLQGGWPVVAPNLGAFPERLQGRAWSWVLSWNLTPEQVLKQLLELRQANFLTTIPPKVLEASVSLAPTFLDWDYHKDYIPTGLARNDHHPLPSVAWLSSHRPNRTEGSLQTLHTGLRQQALRGLVRLRSAPSLRFLTQTIPLRWQTRVKSWLLR